MRFFTRRFRSRRPRKRISYHTWQRISKALLLSAVASAAFGLLLGVLPVMSTAQAVDSQSAPQSVPQSVPFWITRGCFIAPGLVLLFLGYMSLLAARRRERQVRCSEIMAVLGTAAALLPILMGMSVALQPVTEGWVRIMGALLCLWPGLFLLGLVGLFWALVVRRQRSPA